MAPGGIGCWADWQRTWMNNTPQRYAYRCLPLTIVNQTGWWIKNPVGFTAIWRGGTYPGSIEFQFDTSPELWSQWINSQFGEGIITWNTPFLFRTKPEGSRLLVRAGELLQGQCASADGPHRERLDQHVLYDELETCDSPSARPVRPRRAALPGDPPGEQRVRGPGEGDSHLPEALR